MFRTILLLGGCLFASFASAQEPVPVADFARSDDVLSARISPEGNYLATLTRVQDEWALVVVDLNSMKRSGVMVFGREGYPLAYEWVGPRRIVAELVTNHGPLDQPYRTGELYAVDMDGTNLKYLFGYRGKREESGTRLGKPATYEQGWARLVDPLVRDPLHALIEVRQWSGKDWRDTSSVMELVNVVTGARERVGASPVLDPQIIADAAGQPRYVAGTSRDGNSEVWYRPAGNEAWQAVAFRGAAPDPIALHGMHRDGAVAYVSFADPGKPPCLREFRFESKAFADILCGAVEPAPVLSPLDGHPVAVLLEDGLPQMAYPDAEHPDARLLRSLQKSFPGQRLQPLSYSADGTRMVLLVSGDRSPGDYYLVNRTSKKVDYLLGRKKWIDPARMQPVAPIVVKARDGTSVPGYLTARDGLKTRKAPLVVMPHGGPYGVRDYWVWNADAQLLASRGYSVLQVNYRGSGGYGPSFQNAGYRQWGRLMQDDVTDAVKWAVAEGIADPARICIYGASYGGYAALMGAVRDPELYRCAVGFAGVYDLGELLSDTAYATSWLSRAYLERAVGGDSTVLREQSPVTHAARIKAAVLIAHGTQDRIAPFSQAKLLRAALDRNRKPYEWLEFDGEEHGFYRDENRAAFYEKLLAFLDKHIGAGAKGAE